MIKQALFPLQVLPRLIWDQKRADHPELWDARLGAGGRTRPRGSDARLLYEKGIELKLAGNEVYYTIFLYY